MCFCKVKLNNVLNLNSITMKRLLRQIFPLIAFTFLCLPVAAQVIDKDSIWIHMYDGEVKAYSRQNIEKIHANGVNQYVTFSFPATDYTIYEGENEMLEETLEISNEGETRQLNCKADAKVSMPEIDWCTAVNDNGTLIITVSPNTTTEQRTVDIEVSRKNYLLIVHVIQAFRVDELSDIIPEDVLKLFDSSVIPFNPGNNPPNIEGTYFIDPMLLTYSSLEKDNWFFEKQKEGKIIFMSDYIRLTNQNANNILICEMMSFDGQVYSISTDCKVTGSGDRFTLFYKSTLTDALYGAKAMTTDIFSGRWTPSGIEDLSYAFVMIEKDDPNSNFIAVGNCRKFVDGDNIAFNATWPSSPTYAPRNKKAKTKDASVNAMSIVFRGEGENMLLELNGIPELIVKKDKTFDVALRDIVLQNITAEQIDYIQYLHDDSVAPNAIDSKWVEKLQIRISIDDDIIRLSDISETTKLSLQRVDGTVCKVDITRNGDQAQVNISHLVQGMYILQVNNQIIKFQKR